MIKLESLLRRESIICRLKRYTTEAYRSREGQEEVLPAFKSEDCEGLEKDALRTCSDRAMLVKNIKYPLPPVMLAMKG